MRTGFPIDTSLVAGSAAVIKADFPGVNNREVVDRLLTTAEDLGAPGTDVVFGRGLLDLLGGLSTHPLAVQSGWENFCQRVAAMHGQRI